MLRLAHNESRVEPDVELTEDESLVPTSRELDDVTAGKPLNELLVCLVAARNLPVMDKAMFVGKGSSDPVGGWLCVCVCVYVCVCVCQNFTSSNIDILPHTHTRAHTHCSDLDCESPECPPEAQK